MTRTSAGSSRARPGWPPRAALADVRARPRRGPRARHRAAEALTRPRPGSTAPPPLAAGESAVDRTSAAPHDARAVDLHRGRPQAAGAGQPARQRLARGDGHPSARHPGRHHAAEHRLRRPHPGRGRPPAERAEVKRTTESVETKRAEAADHLVEVPALYAESVTAEESRRPGRRGPRRPREGRRRPRLGPQGARRPARPRGRDPAPARRDLRAPAQQGLQGRAGGYLSPPASGPVTSPFGYRIHPIYGYYSLHNGTDFGTGCGAPLYAAAGGTVIDTYYDSVYGNRLYLSSARSTARAWC